MRHFAKKLFFLFCALTLIVLVGTIGYVTIEGWGFFDAFYMAIITITTTGFSEIHPLSTPGRILTIGLLGCGVGMVTFTISQIASYITSIDFNERRRRSMLKSITNMRGHTVVCGYGRMGEVICQRLRAVGAPFVVIEKRAELVSMLRKNEFTYVEGDAAHDESLLQAGIEQAKTLVSVIDNDADALYITVAGRSFNQQLYIIARANDIRVKSRMIRAGADKVILPFVMSGLKVAESVLNPAVEDFLDLAGDRGISENYVQLADMYVDEHSSLRGCSLAQASCDLGELILVGVRKQSGQFIFKPGGAYQFESGDCLISLGHVDDYTKAKKSFGLKDSIPLKSAA